MKLTHLILLAGMTVLTASALAADAPKFTDVDANSDGGIDATEFAAATEAGVKEEFAKLDKNSDGKLSKSEYAIVMGDEDCE